RAQQGAPGVDVVLGDGAAGERHLADHERVLAQLGEQGALRGIEVRCGHGSRILRRRLQPSASAKPWRQLEYRGSQPSSRLARAFEAPGSSTALSAIGPTISFASQSGARRGLFAPTASA